MKRIGDQVEIVFTANNTTEMCSIVGTIANVSSNTVDVSSTTVDGTKTTFQIAIEKLQLSGRTPQWRVVYTSTVI